MGNTEATRLLIDKNANVNAMDDGGHTVLHDRTDGHQGALESFSIQSMCVDYVCRGACMSEVFSRRK